jgi:hypothetical protein
VKLPLLGDGPDLHGKEELPVGGDRAGRENGTGYPLGALGRTFRDARAHLADAKLNPGKRFQAAGILACADRRADPLALICLQIGRVHILGLPGECLVDLQRFAQRSAASSAGPLTGEGSAGDAGDFVAVAAYADLGPGYICTDRAFAEGGYEPTDTAVGPGSEPLLKAAILKLLGK